ncbi:MAG: hypothetical protein J3Q66DRAFT_344806 [Benniella sp.]|nr:MAG: hypothetical protein J3Q66DRAFT_344806 [Benniella sp.]
MSNLPGQSKLNPGPGQLQRSQLLSTVFDLPELTDIIFSHLSKNDLVQWTLVSKKWCHAVIPYIWSNLSTLNTVQHQRLAKMIINDYQTITNGQQSILAKYCPLIRSLRDFREYPYRHREYLLLDFIRLAVEVKESFSSVDGSPLSQAQWTTIHGSFSHFMMHCTHLNALSLKFIVTHSSAHEAVKVVADSAAQHLRHLSLDGWIHERAFKYLMTKCLSLETLVINFTPFSNEKYPWIKPWIVEFNEAGQEPFPNLRRLILEHVEDFFQESYTPFWRRCKAVEALELTYGSPGLQDAVTAIETFFPNLNTISFGEDLLCDTMEDANLARVLFASQVGWRSISIMRYVDFGEQSWKALSQHASTLENFTIMRWPHPEKFKPRPFFTSFPRLRSFVTLSEGWIAKSDIISTDVDEWIHQDPLSGSFTPWLCEISLTDLRIRISGIPRPDVICDDSGQKRQPVVDETYPGEGRMIQHQVYERLSRFVNLEVLWLGHNSCDAFAIVHSNQYECLEMSLESGLDQLEGLKRLRVLNVSLMATRIGQSEARWMAEQWPKLREIHGLEDGDDSRKARKWFTENCPCIATPSLVRKKWGK